MPLGMFRAPTNAMEQLYSDVTHPPETTISPWSIMSLSFMHMRDSLRHAFPERHSASGVLTAGRPAARQAATSVVEASSKLSATRSGASETPETGSLASLAFHPDNRDALRRTSLDTRETMALLDGSEDDSPAMARRTSAMMSASLPGSPYASRMNLSLDVIENLDTHGAHIADLTSKDKATNSSPIFSPQKEHDSGWPLTLSVARSLFPSLPILFMFQLPSVMVPPAQASSKSKPAYNPSKKGDMNMASTAVVNKKRTIISTAAIIIGRARKPLSPFQVALAGLRSRYLRVPKGRNRSYLVQLLQSTMWNNVFTTRHRDTKLVLRPRIGKYRRSSSRIKSKAK